jgi:hypothetical protein
MASPREPLSDEHNEDDLDGADWADSLGVRLGDLVDAALAEGDPSNIYPEDWDVVSRRVREEMEWCCEMCGIDLKDHRGLLHVHHRDLRKQNNSRENLMAVCVLCHARFPNHGHLLDTLSFRDREVFARRLTR